MKGKTGLVKGQNKDDQGEYSKSIQAMQMNSEQKPGDARLSKLNLQAHKETVRARKHLNIKRKK